MVSCKNSWDGDRLGACVLCLVEKFVGLVLGGGGGLRRAPIPIFLFRNSVARGGLWGGCMILRDGWVEIISIYGLGDEFIGYVRLFLM